MPEPEHKPRETVSAKNRWVEIEKMVQLGFMFPAAIFIGWAMGWLLDRWLGTHWIRIAGLVVGMIAPIVKFLQYGLDPKNQQ